MKFQLQATDPCSDARAGIITTGHGQVPTPIFMPVGTVGSVKGVHFEELRRQVKAQIILGNTYHLYLRPGLEVLRAAGGLHGFNGWERPILTDSGGFQVFSLTGIRKLREEGCEFRSHIDGSKHFFTPESVMDTQRVIGADIMMAFDECPPGQSDYGYARESLMLTQRWLDRCIRRLGETEPLYGYEQTLFPIVQGCTYKDLRREAAKYVADKGADGNAIGGLAVGEPTEVMYEMIEVVNEILPKDKPRYLMGVGTPRNLLEAIERGVDMFDCVMPTRNGRNAMLFTYEGTMNMRNKKWEMDFSPLDSDGCEIDRVTSKAYLHHLFKAQGAGVAGHADSQHPQPGVLPAVGDRRQAAHHSRRLHGVEEERRGTTGQEDMMKTFGELRKHHRWYRVSRWLGKSRGKAGRARYVKKLDWYIIKKFVGTYIFSIALIISISIVFDVNENLAKFSQYHAPLKDIVFDYYANFVPYFANLFSALFVFIAVIFFTSKMADNSEIIAIQAAGVSFKRLLRPYMISCVLISSLSFYLSSYVIPHGTVVRLNFESQYKNKKRVNTADNVQLQVDKGVIAYIQHYDNNRKKGYGFSLDKFEDKKLVSHLTAMEVQYDTISDTKYHWKLRNWKIRRLQGLRGNTSPAAWSATPPS